MKTHAAELGFAELKAKDHYQIIERMQRFPGARYSLIPAALLAVNVSLPASAAEQPKPLLGGWAARLDISSPPAVLRLRVTETPEHDYTATAFVNPEPNGLPALVNRKLIRDGFSWSMAAGEGPNQFRLDIRQTGESFVATYTVGKSSGQAQLRRLSNDAAVNKRYTGAYVRSSGEHIYIRRSFAGQLAGTVLSYLDEKTGRSGILYPAAANSFVAGPSLDLPDPVGLTVTFKGDPTESLEWKPLGKNGFIAKKSTSYDRQDIQIPVPGGLLGCEALIPAGKGKHPGVVLVPGAGGVDRFAPFYVLADVFAHHGIASLACDKRGTGVSTGDWRYQAFEQQAQDVVEGMRYLRDRSEVDTSRVGVWAFSQGTYVGPIAASIGNAAFLILVADFAINLREHVVITNVERLRRQGLPNEEIERYKDYTKRWHQAIMEKDFKTAERAYQQYEGASWLPRNRPVEQAWTTDWSWDRARLTWAYQPGPILRTLKMPVFAFWGSEDQQAPPSLNRAPLEQALRDAGNSDYTLRVIAGAGHELAIEAPLVGIIGYTPEYIPGMLEWLRTRVPNKLKN